MQTQCSNPIFCVLSTILCTLEEENGLEGRSGTDLDANIRDFVLDMMSLKQEKLI